MSVYDILERGGYARRRLKAIETELEVRESHLGVQGHGYAMPRISGTLDVMRNVDAMLDVIGEFNIERSTLEADLEDAKCLIRGIKRTLSEALGSILELHFLRFEDAEDIALDLGLDLTLVGDAITRGPSELDALVPRLMRAGKEA